MHILARNIRATEGLFHFCRTTPERKMKKDISILPHVPSLLYDLEDGEGIVVWGSKELQDY